jgi:hypothetical protein
MINLWGLLIFKAAGWVWRVNDTIRIHKDGRTHDYMQAVRNKMAID